jgi:hypothetical protein
MSAGLARLRQIQAQRPQEEAPLGSAAESAVKGPNLRIQTASPPVSALQPYINNQRELIIPFDCDARYHWWAAGRVSLRP